MRVIHLLASPFYGGPERQVLGLARHLPVDVESVFLSFSERGLAHAFLDEAGRHGFETRALQNNTPHYFACVSEVASELRRLDATLLCCSGYKADLVGWRAARRVGIPVISISHGWTAATWRVRAYEALDRWTIRFMDAIACVSNAQADKVRRAGVADGKIHVIHNAIGAEAFAERDPSGRSEMESWFARKPTWLIGAAGRLSPEKGFADFIDAAAVIAGRRPDAGFVLFGAGPRRADLERRIAARGLRQQFILAGFRTDLDHLLPNLDVAVISSYTEGLPVVLLEAGAAGVPTVATAVGGIPEVIDDGQSGFLVPPGNPAALAERIVAVLEDDELRGALGRSARRRVRSDFSFVSMSQRYLDLFDEVVNAKSHFPLGATLPAPMSRRVPPSRDRAGACRP